jgi:hypothetical protein
MFIETLVQNVEMNTVLENGNQIYVAYFFAFLWRTNKEFECFMSIRLSLTLKAEIIVHYYPVKF